MAMAGGPPVEMEVEKKPEDLDAAAVADITQCNVWLSKGVSKKESRFVFRVLRKNKQIRRQLNPRVIMSVVSTLLGSNHPTALRIKSYITANEGEKLLEVKREPSQSDVLPETEVYVFLLVLINLIDTGKTSESVKCSEEIFDVLGKVPGVRICMRVLASRIIFYYARAHELNGSAQSIRGELYSFLRDASLRNDDNGQAICINLLLRNFCQNNLYEQAELLVSKTKFPDNVPNGETARYLYYLGRIKAIKLDYSVAYKNLEMARRKAPSKGAVGFRQAVGKMSVIVQLLIGEIPDIASFKEDIMSNALKSYLQLTQAVRLGDLGRFESIVQENRGKFREDRTYTLILRLRHNVIKTGIRAINLSYSCISLEDVAQKLQLESAEDAEYITGKAIRDGVINASIDHVNGCVRSKELLDVYSTNEPQQVFHQRIEFCLNIYNDSVKAMRFPPDAYKQQFETDAERKERLRQEADFAEEVSKEEEEEF